MKKLIILIPLLWAGIVSAQTHDTNNDVRVTWNCALLLSTNQFVSAYYVYKLETNGMVNPPNIADWVRGYARSAVVDLCNSWEARKSQAEQAKVDFDRIRTWWMTATDAQRTALVAGLPALPAQ